MDAIEILRRDAVRRITGLSDSSLDRAEGFPQAVKLGARSVGWVRAEVESWLRARVAMRDSKAGAK